MKKRLLLIAFFALSTQAGCTDVKSFVQQNIPFGDKLITSAYYGPKAKIVVADFETNANKADPETAACLRSMLIEELAASNRYFLVERQEPADIIISVAISDFEPQSSGGSQGIGGGGSSANSALGSLMDNTLNRAHIGFDVRIADATSTKIITSRHITGQSGETGSALEHIKKSKGALRGRIAVFNNTDIEIAVRIGIAEAGHYIASAIPAGYYKYNRKD
jgi:curli biogenesis system outer membrane secretion channel CsgG